MTTLDTNRLDRIGAATSFACAIHCGIMPLFLTILPLIGLGWLASEPAEWTLFACSAIIGSTSLCYGYKKHRSTKALRLLAAGLCALAMGRIGDMHHWAPYYVVLLVIGGVVISISHWLNHKLCSSCASCSGH